MGFVWNRELKKLAAAFLTIFFVGIILTNLCMGMYRDQMREQYHGLLASLFGNVLTVYPEVAEEELIRILNGYQEYSLGTEVLAKYGLLEDYGSASFAVLERQTALLYAGVNALLSLLFLACALLLFFYLRKRQRKISGLAGYMEELNRDNYRLDVEDNSDDELTGLRNEVYKTTVLLREQADRAGRQKRALADSVADISHQLKTPLTSMTILVDNLSEDVDMNPDTRRHFMAEISRQLTGMSWLITTMLKISRLDAGVVELERTKLNVRALVEEALGRLEIAAEWRNVSFAVDIPEDAEMTGDRKWTGEALMNILKNAIEHSPAGGEVEISGEENDVYTQIEIRDHGTGVGEEERRRLFERFYRGASPKEDSIGIGLSLAKEIVEKQGGYIAVEAAPGEGCIFRLKFLRTYICENEFVKRDEKFQNVTEMSF